jgi:hypothetical protein
MKMRPLVLSSMLVGILALFPAVADAHFTLVQPASWLATDNGGKGPPPCGEGVPSNAITKVQGGHPIPIKLIETVIHPGHYRVALSVNSRIELPVDPDVFADKDDQSISATIQTPKIPVIADGLFPHTTAPVNATWQTELLLPNINCARCTLQVIEFMAEHGPNTGGGYFYHQCADLEITADPSIGPPDEAWTPPVNVSVSPSRVGIKPGTTQQFLSSVTGTSNASVTWTANGGVITNNGVYTSPAVPGNYTVTATSASDPSKSASATVAVDALNEELYFAQFANGVQPGTSITSEITLIPLAAGNTATVTVEINDDAGNPLAVRSNGAVFPGRLDLIIPANGSAVLKLDAQGPIQTGSITVRSDVKLSGIIFFSGSVGFSSVPDSKRLKKFSVPVKFATGIATGIALMGLGQSPTTVRLELRSKQGNSVARANVSIGPKQHIAKFVDEFDWDLPIDFSDFSGHLLVTGSSELAATALLITSNGSAAVPVAEIP